MGRLQDLEHPIQHHLVQNPPRGVRLALHNPERAVALEYATASLLEQSQLDTYGPGVFQRLDRVLRSVFGDTLRVIDPSEHAAPHFVNAVSEAYEHATHIAPAGK